MGTVSSVSQPQTRSWALPRAWLYLSLQGHRGCAGPRPLPLFISRLKVLTLHKSLSYQPVACEVLARDRVSGTVFLQGREGVLAISLALLYAEIILTSLALCTQGPVSCPTRTSHTALASAVGCHLALSSLYLGHLTLLLLTLSAAVLPVAISSPDPKYLCALGLGVVGARSGLATLLPEAFCLRSLFSALETVSTGPT